MHRESRRELGQIELAPVLRGLLLVFLTGLAACAVADGPWFRVVSRDHIWWLERGSAKPFWSLGVDCTEIGGPGKEGNPNYDGLKLFGSAKIWAENTLSKYKSWGVNTLGGWSDFEYFGERIPYTEVLHLGAYDMAPWHDLYSKQTEALISKAAQDLIPKHRADPMLIGYFTDNELGWWDDTIFLTYFGFPETSPGKAKLVSVLRAYYKNDFRRFSADWETTATGFDDLSSQKKIFLKPGTAGIKAVHAFNYELASHYYELVHRLVRKFDPNHLILGDRYCQYYNLETVKAAKPWIDVISSNAGADWLDGTYTKFYFDNLYRLTSKPVMVTEFYFSAKQNQSGNGNSGDAFPLVQTQAQRTKGFATCLYELASKPYMVGAHWFQFHDEPPKGRGDGENWNFGLEDIYGKPYNGMISALKNFNANHVHAAKPTQRLPGVPRAPDNPMSDHLLRWDRSRGYIHSSSLEQWADLYATYDDRNLYLGFVSMEYSDPHLYKSAKIPEEDLPEIRLQISGWKGSIRFGEGIKPIYSQGIGEVAERPGLKHIVEIRFPIKSLGLAKLSKSKNIKFRASLTSHGRGYQMQWDQELSLN